MVVDSIASSLCQDFLVVLHRYPMQITHIVLDRKQKDKLELTY